MKKLLLFLLPVMLLVGCNKSGIGEPSPESNGDMSGSSLDDAVEGGFGDDAGGGIGGGGNQGGQSEAGKVTAAEWRDLDNWQFWSALMTNSAVDQEGNNYTSYSSYWEFYTNNRVAVRVLDGSDSPQEDVAVSLVRIVDGEQKTLYEGRTDNKGEVNMWIGLTQLQKEVDEKSLAFVVDGTVQQNEVSVTHWSEDVKWNTLTASAQDGKNIDIAFIVDATGSMSDEINFLKADLTSIIKTVYNKHADADIRTAAVFYRDEEDDYLTRTSDFSEDLSTTVSFIAEQEADGGGDYPEAVHTALEVGLQKLSWREHGSMRIAFMLLDAPPHKNEAVIESLHKSIPQYARLGIRVIPVAASGVDKPTEFFLRFAAMATDGTYVFITNDSGIGNDHIQATVGDYKVELLGELMVRLIDQYLQ